MRILSMTATFGKLEHETLTLSPGLNLLEAPNEWGKSTWCAFLVAMLYGIETRQQTTKAALADKERYAPWSGQSMSGRMDILWQGRAITLERSTKGRSPLGVFKAYETETGLPVPELTADNCGQQLLGVEKEVFLRSGFLRLSDLPLTQSESLRRRLNALVTTGDESGDAERLAQRLTKLKNEIWVNRSKGLLPRTREQLESVTQKLQQLEALQKELEALQARERELQTRADEAARAHLARLKELQAQCAALPDEAALRARLEALQSLQQELTATQLELEQLPPPPQMPVCPVEGCADPVSAAARLEQLTVRRRELEAKLRKKPFPLWLLGLVLLAAAPFIWPVHTPAAIGCGALGFALTLAGSIAAVVHSQKRHELRQQLLYLSLPVDEKALESYRVDYAFYQASLAHHGARREALVQRLSQLHSSLRDTASTAQLQQQLRLWQQLADARREAPDQTDSDSRRSQIQLRIGSCQGQMSMLGSESALTGQKLALEQRCRELERTYSAVTLALQTLQAATAQLQKRFAPRISRRSRELLSRLTDGRYDRLILTDALSVETGAADEDTLRSALWRSDGTADQLYLAVRLAVAEELTPDAPLVLDDALVRFDDGRLRSALQLLREEAQHKQILLFTCQGRERAALASLGGAT